MRTPSPPFRQLAALCRACRDEGAAQIAEFAISLPLLVVFVVGIFDFSGALTLKQKLTNAAREGARVAAADPANDLGNGSSVPPVSVSDAFYVVDDYLLSQNINDCGLKSVEPSSAGNFIWKSTTPGCPGGPSSSLLLTINRGCITSQMIGTVQTDLIDTCVTIQYPYKWRFNSVITLLVPNTTYASVSYITATATAFNEN